MTPDPHWRLVRTRTFVEALGFRLGLDLDRSLIIRPPEAEAVSVEAITELLEKCAHRLAEEIEGVALMDSSQLVGGPFNGQRHGFCGSHRAIALKVARANWAAYYMGQAWKDRRAFYVGRATSETKARKLALSNGQEVIAKMS